jgi:hypothetical protein
VKLARIASVLAAFGLATISCADLYPIDRNTCGNGVVEVAIGEECDGVVGTVTCGNQPCVCGAQGTVAACRFDCSSAGTSGVCPADHGCGKDGVCRSPSGIFVESTRFNASFTRLDTARFSDPIRKDIVARTRATIDVYALEAGNATRWGGGALGDGYESFGDLNGDGLDDAVFTSRGLTAVLLGSADRRFQGTVYPTFSVEADEAYALPVEILPARAGREQATFAALNGQWALTYVPEPMMKLTLASGALATGLASAPLVGRFEETIPCDTVVLPLRSPTGQNDRLVAIRLCRKVGPMGAEQWVPNEGATPVVVPLTSRMNSALMGDVDGDGHLDLAVCVGPEHMESTIVFRGLGNGAFDNGQRLALLDGRRPLAVGDVDGDGKSDWVAEDGAYCSSLGTWTPLEGPGAPKLVAAHIGDFNANGRRDLVAVARFFDPGIRRTVDRLLFLNGTATSVLYTSGHDLEGELRSLEVADMDGDLVPDLVVATHPTEGNDRISVLWGRAFGTPEAPTRVGSLPNVRALSSAVAAPPAEVLNVMSEVRSETKREQRLAYLPANTSRFLYGPLGLADGEESVAAVPTKLGGNAALLIVGRNEKTKAARLWWAPLTGDAELTPAGLSKANETLVAGFDPDAIELATLDLGGSARDLELVGLGSDTSSTAEGPILVAAFAYDGKNYVTLGEPQRIGVGVLEASRLLVGDVDGDGDEDVVVFVASERPYIRFVPNEGTGRLEMGKAMDVPTPPTTRGATLVDVGGRGRSIALATLEGVFVTKYAAPAFEPPRRLLGVPTSRITAGDVDGDGLEDLVLGVEAPSKGQQVVVFLQRDAAELRASARSAP